jgi:hypothetical protein
MFSFLNAMYNSQKESKRHPSKRVPTNKIANSKQRVGITHQKVAHIHTEEVRRTPLLILV